MIRKFDENLALKSNKTEFFELRNSIEKLVTVDKQEALKEELIDKMDDFKGDLNKISETMDIV